MNKLIIKVNNQCKVKMTQLQVLDTLSRNNPLVFSVKVLKGNVKQGSVIYNDFDGQKIGILSYIMSTTEKALITEAFPNEIIDVTVDMVDPKSTYFYNCKTLYTVDKS